MPIFGRGSLKTSIKMFSLNVKFEVLSCIKD
jgi:hypothetical protein